MKAARYYGPGDIRVEQIPEPQPKRGQIKVKIAWNGICGTDLHCYLVPFIKSPTATEPNELTGETLPITLGHEFSGTVVEVGEDIDAKKFPIGQNVVIEPVISCMKNTCDPCTAGTRNLCNHVNCVGIGGGGGGLAEYISVDENLVHPLPDGISLEVGACIEPLAVSYYCVKRSGFKAGDKVLIFGAGPIGLFLLKVIRSIDPSALVIVSEPTPRRRSLAVKHGASIALDSTQEDIIAKTLEATNGNGVDISFDAAGAQASMDAAVFSTRPRGKLVVVAAWEKPPQIDMNVALIKELTIMATNTYTGVHAELLEIVAAGKITGIEELITSKVALEDVVEKGIKALLHDKDSQVKILIHP